MRGKRTEESPEERVRKVWIALGIVLALALAIGAFISIKVRRYKEKVRATTIEDVPLSQVRDGVYEGYYDVDLVKARVRVTVKDHRIENVELVEHEHGRGEKAEVLPRKVVEEQSVNVDIVSGATSSSKTILKAIENALRQGLE